MSSAEKVQKSKQSMTIRDKGSLEDLPLWSNANHVLQILHADKISLTS